MPEIIDGIQIRFLTFSWSDNNNVNPTIKATDYNAYTEESELHSVWQ